MNILYNGKHCDLEIGTTLSQFLEKQGLSRNCMIVELNGEIVDAEDIPVLKDQDELNLFRIVAGG